MPNKWTFTIKPIKELIRKYHNSNDMWLDPFAGKNSPATYTNDLHAEFGNTHSLDAREFIKTFDDEYADGIFYDPPYSPRQLKECYDGIGKTLTQDDTKATFWSDMKDEMTRVVKIGGIIMSFGWSSNGIGKTRGFEILEILLVPHGGMHNDTIVVVERKLPKVEEENIDIFEGEMEAS